MKIVFAIERYRPGEDAGPHWQEFTIEAHAGMTVLDGLRSIREHQEPTLSWRSSCRMGICGSCAMIINGRPGLACNTQVLHVSETRVRLQALWNFPVMKDLVPDLGSMFEKHASLSPYLVRPEADDPDAPLEEFLQTPEEQLEYLQFSYCIKCGACMAACPTLASDPRFLGPMPMAAAHRYNTDTRDAGFRSRRHVLGAGHAASHCHYAGECSRVCPKGVDPARAIQLARRDLALDLLGLRRGRPPAPPVPASGTGPRVEPLPAPPYTVVPLT